MPDFASIEESIREQAKKWMEDGEVKYVIGYERGEGPNLARPCFVYEPGDVGRLTWSPHCQNNLTRYVVEEMKYKPKRGEEPDLRPVAVVVKPCDSKAMVELIKEHQVPRERVRIIGLTCTGVIDREKLNGDGETSDITEGNIADKCAVCYNHNPIIFDVEVGERVEEKGKTEDDNYDDIKDLLDRPLEERWEYWKEQLSKCVRCYACRESCPLCYCTECIFERVKPYNWNEKSVQLGENLFYHTIRGLHLAGRCIDCGECERACPVGIPIRQINRSLRKRVKERFGIEPGMRVEDECMFGAYAECDPQEEIW